MTFHPKCGFFGMKPIELCLNFRALKGVIDDNADAAEYSITYRLTNNFLARESE